MLERVELNTISVSSWLTYPKLTAILEQVGESPLSPPLAVILKSGLPKRHLPFYFKQKPQERRLTALCNRNFGEKNEESRKKGKINLRYALRIS